MKRIRNWKTLAFVTILPLLITLQPAITYACSGAGTHGGCA